MKCYGLTDCGTVREENQDEFLIHAYGDSDVLLLLSDGIGGRAGGRTASRTAARIFDYTFSQGYKSLPAAAARESIESVLSAAFMAANRAVYEAAEEDSSLRGMGATLDAVLCRGKTAYSIHIGDSRLSLLRGGRLRTVTKDHTVAALLRDTGEPEPSRAKHTLTRALGVTPDATPDLTRILLRDNDILLLSSDGLHSVLPKKDITAILMKEKTPKAAASALISSANEVSGSDNVTALLAYIGKEKKNA